jgi:hypothetical protein
VNLSPHTIDDAKGMVGNPASCLHVDAVPSGRRIAIDEDGMLWSLHDEPIGMTTDQLFTVLVLWTKESGTSWLGWLTTKDHRAACFTALDLDDPLVERWIGDLPRWDRRQLSRATTCRGFHLVWRCRE